MGALTRVLYVGDESNSTVSQTVDILRDDGDCIVETVASGERALAALTESTYDCLVVEDGLPMMDVIGFIKTVRRGQLRMPIVLYPESGDERLASEAIGCGVTDYLPKGNPETLRSRINQAVAKQSVQSDQHALRCYQSLVEHSPDVMVVLDEWGVVEYQSPVPAESVPYEPRDMTGEHPQKYIHPEDVERTLADFVRLWDHPGETVITEYRIQDATGEWHWCESRAQNYLGEEPIDGILVSIRDITKRKKREAELKRQKQRLDEFASFVSHDLRNPLDVATLRLDLVARESESEHTDEVMNALNRMEERIDDLLDRARYGITVEDTDPLSLADAVENAWQNVDTNGTSINCRDDVTMYADESQLLAIFENLFRNAVEHGDATEIAVGVLSDAPGFYVADDGDGIPADEREQVFTAGYSTKSHGTGLGLVIVRDIIEAHEWEVAIRTSKWDGTRFEITGVRCCNRPQTV